MHYSTDTPKRSAPSCKKMRAEDVWHLEERFFTSEPAASALRERRQVRARLGNQLITRKPGLARFRPESGSILAPAKGSDVRQV